MPPYPPCPSRSASRHLRAHGSTAAAALLLAALAAAQEQGETAPDLTELSLEDLLEVEVGTVWGASRQLQRTTEAPASVSVVDRRDVRTFGQRTLADVLRAVGGFDVTNDRNYEHLGVRGFNPIGDYNSRVLLSIDGHRVNNNVYDSAPIGLEFPLDVDLIDHVEVIRGAGSALYGSNAFFGVIDVGTRRGRDVGGLELAAEGGSFGTYRTRATYGTGTDGGLDWLASGTLFTRAGPELYYPEYAGTASGGWTEGTDDEQGFSLFSQVQNESWRLQAAWASRDKGIPTASYGTVFDDPSNATTDAQGYVDLSHESEVGDAWDLAARVHYDYYEYWGNYVYDDTANGGPPDLANVDRGWGQWIGGDAQLSRAVLERHRVTLGAEARSNLRRDQANYDATANYLDDEREGYSTGVFAQDEIRVAEGWTFAAGLRHDRYDTFGGATSPRLSLVWNPTPESALKLVYGQAYRAPNAYEQFYGDGYSAKANPDLEPETIESAELIAERHFDAGWRASAAFYRYAIDDLILQVTDPVDGLLVFQNTGRVTGSGVELELERRFENGARVVGSLALQGVEDETTGARPPNSAEQVAKLLGETPLFSERARLGVELLATGERPTLAGDETEAFAILNAWLGFEEFAPGVSFALGIRNALDEDYGDPGGGEHLQDVIAQDGRAWLVQLTLRR